MYCARVPLVSGKASGGFKSMFTRFLVLVLVSASVAAEAQQTASRIGRVLEGAYQQIGKTTIYDSTYRRLSFPGGDVPLVLLYHHRPLSI